MSAVKDLSIEERVLRISPGLSGWSSEIARLIVEVAGEQQTAEVAALKSKVGALTIALTDACDQLAEVNKAFVEENEDELTALLHGCQEQARCCRAALDAKVEARDLTEDDALMHIFGAFALYFCCTPSDRGGLISVTFKQEIERGHPEGWHATTSAYAAARIARAAIRFLDAHPQADTERAARIRNFLLASLPGRNL